MTLMPEFRRQLLDAAANRPDERGRWHSGLGLPRFGLTRLRPHLGVPIAATVSNSVVVAVVAVVLTNGRAHRGVGAPSGQRDSGTQASRPPARSCSASSAHSAAATRPSSLRIFRSRCRTCRSTGRWYAPFRPAATR